MSRPPSDDYLRFLSAYDPSITRLALAVRAIVLAEAPDAIELVYDAYSAVAAGYTFTGRPSDIFIHIAAYKSWVNLGFNRGSELSDPGCLLRGEGRYIRHIRISSIADVERPFVRRFVQAAVAAAPRASAETAKPEPVTVVRSMYKKKRRPR